jgi:hypothetical protein
VAGMGSMAGFQHRGPDEASQDPEIEEQFRRWSA